MRQSWTVGLFQPHSSNSQKFAYKFGVNEVVWHRHHSRMNKKPSQICRYFAASGNCYYGDSCQFSHGGGFQTEFAGPNRGNTANGSRGDSGIGEFATVVITLTHGYQVISLPGSMLNADPLFQAFSAANGMGGVNGAVTPDYLPAESKLKLYMVRSRRDKILHYALIGYLNLG